MFCFSFLKAATLLANYVASRFADWDNARQVWQVWWINGCGQRRQGSCRRSRAELISFFFFVCFVDDLIILFLVSLLKHFLFILILAHFECYRGLWCFLYLWTFLFTDRSRWILLDKVFEYNIRFETLTQSKLGGIWILVNYDKKKG